MRTTAMIIGLAWVCVVTTAVAYSPLLSGRGVGVRERPVADDSHALTPDPSPKGRGELPLTSLAFLTGTWRGEMNGEFVEEIWSVEQGGAMMGMFRWLGANGQPRMYELLTISREEDATFLRLRHFNSKMVAWEEKDAPVVLRLNESTPGRAIFTNVNEEDRMKRITFNQPEKGRLEIDVDFGEEREALAFRFDRGQE